MTRHLSQRSKALLELDAKALLVPQEGFYYEPRALWGSSMIANQLNGGQYYSIAGRIDPNTLYNGEPYPLILTHAIVQWMTEGGRPQMVQQAASAIGVSIATAGGPRYGKNFPPIFLEPRMRSEPVDPAQLQDNPQPTDITIPRPTVNRCAWDYELQPELPPDAMLEIFIGARVPTLTDTTTSAVYADVNLYAPTRPGDVSNFPQTAYTRQALAVAQLNIASASARYAPQRDALIAQYIASGDAPPTFTLFTGYTGGAEAQNFPPTQQLTPNSMLKQKASFSVPTMLGGLAVSFDELDIPIAARNVAGPLSFTTPMKVRTRNGGTGAYWWRENAPISLVSPSMSPALVSKLSRPLTLAPGEALDVQMLQGALNAPVGEGGEDDILSFFYISFCGYAAVEA